ncbi:MAG: aldehyde dehydrogenase family protein, partial [Flavobacteriales bacterium]|nr:aldehyde dehydrogenase family protein [Flavobacteriales bacterium]
MPKGLYQIPYPDNEPVLGYAPGSEELESLLSTYHEMLNQEPIDMPMYIGAEKVRTSNKMPINPPHDHAKVLGHFNYGDASPVTAAIDAALDAKAAWSSLPWEHRASIFLKAAELLA